MNENQTKLKAKIHNLENIVNQNVISQEDRQILLKEVERLKQELDAMNSNK